MTTGRRRQDVLLTWLGAKDPVWDNPRTGRVEAGPILSLLGARRFDIVYVLFTLQSQTDDFRRRANLLYRYCEREMPAVTIKHHPMDVVAITDYRELYRLMSLACATILAEDRRDERDYFAYLSPGTPQMQTVWVLLAQGGQLPARLLAATPPDLLAPGATYWHEVDLSLPGFPAVTMPGTTELRLGALEAQRDNLLAETQRLAAELELLRLQAEWNEDILAEGPLSLPDVIRATEATYFKLALARAGGNAAAAARLLGLAPAAFRARAATLGVRPRQPRPPEPPLATLDANPGSRR